MAGNQKKIFLDIKSNKIIDREIAKNIVNLIKKYHLQENVYVESFNPIFLIQMRLISREIILMYDFVETADATKEEVQSQSNRIPWILKQPWIQKQVRRIVRPDVLGPRFNTNEDMLRELVKHGYPIITWTVDDPNIASELYKIGIKGFQTNMPTKVQAALPQKSKISYDAGGTRVTTGETIFVNKVEDIIETIKKATLEGKKITVAGRRHSMGGQSLLEKSLQLDMLNFNRVTYNSKTKTVIAQAGATWKKVQDILDTQNRSVKVMQSDNIFTVGGSISVNVHGWQIGLPPIASTVIAMNVVTPDGQIKHISRDSEPELFKLVIGGYGLFAIVIDVELETVKNSHLTFKAYFTTPKNLSQNFEELITRNPKIELAYARLSVDRGKLFDEAGLFWYEKSEYQTQPEIIKSEKLVALKRSIFRMSEYSNLGKKLRWKAEKLYASNMLNAPPISRNNAMNSDIHLLWPLYGNNKDILHEYFVPKSQLYNFILDLNDNVIEYGVNLLNVTIREVRQDNTSFLSYALGDVFGLVCLFSQKQTTEDEQIMEEFTRSTITKALELGGSFYLPYRLHYNKEQLLKAYPMAEKWISLKKKYDPQIIFDSNFFQHVSR